MIQILRSPNIIEDSHSLRSGLGYSPWAKEIPDRLFQLAWLLRRAENDFITSAMHTMHRITSPLNKLPDREFSKVQQWAITAGTLTLCGLPVTPLYFESEAMLLELLHSHPVLATALIAGHFGFSVFAVRYLFLKVLNQNRFQDFNDDRVLKTK